MSFPANIRAYFDERIVSIDPDLIEIDDALDDEPINNVEADRGYKMVLGNIDMEIQPNFHSENISVLLKIFARPIRDELATYDDLYCKAQDIKNSIIDKKNQDNYVDKNWTAIFPVSLVPSSEDTDDKLFKMDLEFTVRRDLPYTT